MASCNILLAVVAAVALIAGARAEYPFTTLPTCQCGQPSQCDQGGDYNVCYKTVTETVTLENADGTKSAVVQTNTGACYKGKKTTLTTRLSVEQTVTDDNFVTEKCPDCTVAGSGCGDPVITGYDGRAFDFKGEHDRYFNLISEEHHLVNAKFVDAMLKDHDGNFMGEIGFKYMNHTVKAAISAEGVMTVEIDGEEQPFEQVTKEMGDFLVEIEPHFPQLGHVVVMTTPLMVFRAEAIKPFDDAFSGHNRGYLNILSILRDKPTAMHGILGQTAFATTYYPLGDMQFHGDGGEADYEVSSLFAKDYQYNQFTFSHLAKATRRMLAEPQLITSDKPLHAGHTALAKHFL